MDIVISKNISRCASFDVPSIPDYLSATNVYGVSLVTAATIALIIVIVIFVDTLQYIVKNSSATVKAHSAFVIGVYPVTSLVTYFALLVPRAHLLAEAITQGAFMAGMYQLFCLFVAYCGGEAALVEKAQPRKASLKVGPLCCLPCCWWLPTFDITKDFVRKLRLMVLQLPVVQGLLYLILLVMWAERESLYQVNYMYLQPIVVVSILFGIWAMSITINILKDVLSTDYLLIGKFLVLQMVLIFAKLQGLITRAMVWFHVLPCNPPITPQVYANLIHNSLMLLEMILLGLAGRRIYKRILPSSETSGRVSTIGNIMTTELCTKENNNDTRHHNYNKNIRSVDVKMVGCDNLGAEIC